MCNKYMASSFGYQEQDSELRHQKVLPTSVFNYGDKPRLACWMIREQVRQS